MSSFKPIKALYIDFDDSFSNNILELFNSIDLPLYALNWRSCDVKDLEQYQDNINFIVLGPGPGHINEYRHFLDSKINHILNSKNIKKIGICLGHQLLLNYFYSFEIRRSTHPIHGRTCTVDFSKLLGKKSSFELQRYNSWHVKPDMEGLVREILLFDEHSELSLFKSDQLLTMQFHPESVGTNLPQELFSEIIQKFVYS